MARTWRTVARNVGELEAVMALAFILPLGALALGFYRGNISYAAHRNKQSLFLLAPFCTARDVDVDAFAVARRAFLSQQTDRHRTAVQQ